MLTILRFVSFHEIRDRSRKLAHLKVATSAQFVGNILRNVFRPTLRGIEGDHPNRAAILAGKQVGDDGFQVSCFSIFLGATPTVSRPRLSSTMYMFSPLSGTIEGVQFLRIKKLHATKRGFKPTREVLSRSSH